MNNGNNNNLTFKFIDDLFNQLNRGDAVALGRLLKIKNERYRKIYFKEDAKRYFTENLENSSDEIYSWSEVIEQYILARNSLFNDDLPNSFEHLTKSFKSLIDLIKDAKDENWQLPVLFTMSVDLRLLAYTCDARKSQFEKNMILER